MLNERQRKFALEYVKSGNATSAAIAAGYSAKTAHQIGHQLLKHSSVAPEIVRLTGRTEKKSQLTAERLVEELSNLAFVDPKDIWDDAGNLKPLSEIPESARRAIACISDKGAAKLHSKQASLELAAKILGMVKDQQVQQAAVQIIIGQPPELPAAPVEQRQLLPEWE